ncbi:MAG: acyl-CoA dehydrogenase family protein [Ilumatobacteraceae bacterium]|nr:acyl-CoA dehydrogenase family protein [Ilumatobacteraceae bacterium]
MLMHIGDSPEEAAFRDHARTWLAQHAPLYSDDASQWHDDLGGHITACKKWQHVLYDNGWAGISWPKQFGGRGGTSLQASIFAEEQSKFDVATGSFAVSLGMVGPTLMAHGTPEQHAEFLQPMLRGDHVWCQLFSEPNAGSDLANIGTRAVLDGDTWIVNGQKVWTSFGQFSDYGILLTRTEPESPKHKGITYFILDMKSAGIEVRPLVQITGVAHFNEVFLSDVRIPVANVLGQVNNGWAVANTTLTSERAFIGGGGSSWTVEALIETAQKLGRTSDPRVRQKLAAAYARAQTLTYLGYRLRTASSLGLMPGPEMFVMKLAYARHWEKTMDTAMEILGADATLWGEHSIDSGQWQHHLLSQFAIRLGGGTNEIQQNIIGERGLGLPREPSVDRDLPWRELVKG